jgi:UDP-glucuronate 4-epimerase
MKIFVTGSAGFIGFHLCRRLLDDGHDVLGVDNLNAYYDVNLKKARLSMLTSYDNFMFKRINIADRESMTSIFAENHFDRVVNLAAQAGVRYSLENPYAYIDANVSGFMNILEGCRHYKVPHLIYASSSSVYGLNTLMPFSVHHNVDHPVSLYAATKKSNELMAHAYSYLYDLPVTGLRFFTVYGPWGRPDMALFLFTRAILADEPIKIFNHGNLERDFTYIDDIIEGVVNVMGLVPSGNPNGIQTDLTRVPAKLHIAYTILEIISLFR